MLQTLLNLSNPNSARALPLVDVPLDDSFAPAFFVALAVLAALVGAALLVILLLRRYRALTAGLERRVLLVTIPKDQTDQDHKKEQSVQNIQEAIGVADGLFANLGGVHTRRTLKKLLWGRTDTIAFEIVAQHNVISFYVAVDHELQQFVEQQIQAQYPHAHIELVEDYNIFTPTGVIKGTLLQFKREFFFPIKTYKQLETDPLSSLTNALSKVNDPEGAAIQVIVRSAHHSWHAKAAYIASQVHQGKKMSEVMSTNWASKIADTLGKGFFGLMQAMTNSPEKQREQEREEKKEYRLSDRESEMLKGIEEKASHAGLDVTLRLVVSAETEPRASLLLENLANAFSQFSIYEYGNAFAKYTPRSLPNFIRGFVYRSFDEYHKVLLSSEELASVFHLPTPFIDTPNIRWLLAKKAPAAANVPKEGLYLGYNLYRGVRTDIFMKPKDRQRHMYIIGKSGMGKSFLIANLARQDIQNGEGVCVIDPHGDLVADILAGVPKERADDVILFEPADMSRPMGLNMLEADSPDERDFAVQEMIAIFYKLFPPEMIGPMFEHNMRNVMLTLMSDPENPGTIAEIPRMFSDDDFQKQWVAKVTDPVVRSFWEKEMAKTSDFHKSEMLGYLISKVGRFVENEMMRNIIGQTHSAFDFNEVMDKKKILLVNLSKGKTGEVNSNLLGLIIVAKLQMAALKRASIPEEQRHDFYLYIDEFQNFITDSIATILSEARKYRLDLIIAHQYMGQLVQSGNDTKIRDAVLGNAGTMVSFRIGVDDAEILAKEFAPVFSAFDMVNVEKFTAYIKLLVDNEGIKPFNMHTVPLAPGNKDLAEAIRELSRLKYGRERKLVADEILERTQLGSAKASAETPPVEATL